MGKCKKLLTYLLVAFSLISIGFAFGKHSVTIQQANAIQSDARYVAVYYLHSSFRCVTCNTIEKMTLELLDQSYINEIESDIVRFQEVDFQENEQIAKQFNVIASCVVVALIDEGKIKEYKRLDEVWTRMQDAHDFNAYISSEIDHYLSTVRGEE